MIERTVFCGTQEEIARTIAQWKHGTTDAATVRLTLEYLRTQRCFRKLWGHGMVFQIPGTDIKIDVTPRRMACWKV